MKTAKTGPDFQKKFDFSPPRARPFLASLPAKIDTYEEGVARLFQWRTGLDYYATIDQIVDFIVNTRRTRIVDLLSDTATLALRLAGRKAFFGKIQSFDTNITLLERARQRARYLNLGQVVEFQQFEEPGWPIPDGFAEIAVSIFDFHRQQAQRFLQEAFRILAHEGYLLLAEVIEPRSFGNSVARGWQRFHLRFIQGNAGEAHGVYFDQEEMIRMLFETGFRQIVIQGLKSPSSPRQGIFSLVAATK
ncbi:MAG: class I SAM-dependent methyltransferase [Acidobacteriia bacterium]|nr:class I SAM-dependent methyltransferase [Terriglobia bacterium]